VYLLFVTAHQERVHLRNQDYERIEKELDLASYHSNIGKLYIYIYNTSIYTMN
jgi:hypothetical protein